MPRNTTNVPSDTSPGIPKLEVRNFFSTDNEGKHADNGITLTIIDMYVRHSISDVPLSDDGTTDTKSAVIGASTMFAVCKTCLRCCNAVIFLLLRAKACTEHGSSNSDESRNITSMYVLTCIFLAYRRYFSPAISGNHYLVGQLGGTTTIHVADLLTGLSSALPSLKYVLL